MPEISRFYGISITMYYNDHLPAHFHAVYGGDEAQIEISTGQLLHGVLPNTARRLIKEWTELHRTELNENWNRRAQGEKLSSIKPLD